MHRAYLLILGHADAIAWVLREQRMAFPARPRREVAGLAVGDHLYLYATRSAWRNPKRDRGRVVGHATVASSVRRLDEPLDIAGQIFYSGCELSIDGAAPYPGGVELAPLVPQMQAFPKPQAWNIYLRKPLLALPVPDAELLARALDPHLLPRDQALPTYPSQLRGGEPGDVEPRAQL